MTASLAVGDDIRWLNLSLPEQGKNRFDMEDIQSIRAFARGNGKDRANYDVTLIDDGGRMVRIDVASGKHWEFFPHRYGQKTAVPDPLPLKLATEDKEGEYLGRIYYPYGGDSIACKHESEPPVAANFVIPYPTNTGFRGVLV
ncbi:hypothetical protein SH139x_001081 [Planctomycetaceae bacterium SH139]